MGTFGERLQREREMRGITLEEIAEATKIGTRSLRALEEQDFDKLPGGIFNKGFVRAYSKYLGIDEEQAVADYVDAVNEAQAAGKQSRHDIELPVVDVEEPKSEPVQIPWVSLICLALIISVGFAARSYYANHGWQKLLRRASAPRAANATPNPAAAASEASTTPSGGAVTPAATQPAAPELAQTALVTSQVAADDKAFVVKIHAKELAWVEVEADGKTVVSENLSANADRTVQAMKQVVIRTGNAGGIDVSENDKPLPPLGPKNEVRTLTLTGHGTESR